MQGMIGLMTIPDAYNLGRSYCIAATFPIDVGGSGLEALESDLVPSPTGKLLCTGDLIQCIDCLVRGAKVSMQDNSLCSIFGRSRARAKIIFNSPPFQSSVAILLVANFCANLIEAQMAGTLVDENGSPTQAQRILDLADLTFTSLFTAELSLNLYAHLFREFVSDGWCCFDFLVVTASLVQVTCV